MKVSKVSVSRRASAPHFGQVVSHELREAGERRAAALDVHVLRQEHRELVVGHRHHAAGVAVHDGHRAAPVALARDAPVVEPVVDPAYAPRPVSRSQSAIRSKHSRKPSPEYSPELTTTAFSLSVQAALTWMSTSVSSAGAITWRIGKSEPARELVVALVVAGHGHDRAPVP